MKKGPEIVTKGTADVVENTNMIPKFIWPTRENSDDKVGVGLIMITIIDI